MFTGTIRALYHMQLAIQLKFNTITINVKLFISCATINTVGAQRYTVISVCRGTLKRCIVSRYDFAFRIIC